MSGHGAQALGNRIWLSTPLEQSDRRSASRSLRDPEGGLATISAPWPEPNEPAAGVPFLPAPVRRGYAEADQESLAHPGLALHGLVSDTGGVVIFTDCVVVARVAEVPVLVELG